MGRIHAIEIHDQDWCPAPLRDAATDYLQFTTVVGDQYAGIVSRLRSALARTGSGEVLDLCSGGGGPWPGLEARIREGLEVPLRVQLSDLHPNEDAIARARAGSDGRLSYVSRPVSAVEVPDELTGFRTLFSSFHHFRPAEARQILQDAVDDGRGIAVFEAVERSVGSIVGILFAPLACWVLTPFIRPFRWSRLLFTYLIPVIPLIILFDGIVSCLRIYSPDELRALVSQVDAEGYDWEIGRERIPRTPMALVYLIGHPPARG